MAAKMKHARHSGDSGRENRFGPSSPAPRPGRGRSKGEKAFREQLAREYGVEQPPEAFQRRFEQTLLQLPDQVPVRPRPVYYLLRRTAMAAAALAITFGALLGVNTTYPQLTEALPGLGPVFQAINGGEAVPSPTPQPTPSPEPQKEFQPVALESRGDFPSALQVEDAWCDGKTLLLSLSVEKTPELLAAIGYGEEEAEYVWGGYGLLSGGFAPDTETDSAEPLTQVDRVIQVAGGAESWMGMGELSYFTDNGQDRLQATWRVPLDESIQKANPEEVRVDFTIDDILLVELSDIEAEGAPVYSWYAGFATDHTLTVPVDRSKNRVFTSRMTDNGAVLLSVDYAPSRVEVEMELPEIGYWGDMLLASEEAAADTPLGIFAQLEGRFRAADGSGTAAFPFTLEDYEELAANTAGSNRRRMRFSFASSYAREDCRSPLVLTVKESPLWSSRVVAEFTIDLDTGSMTPSENYKEMGFERADTSWADQDSRTAASFVNGFLCTDVSWRDDRLLHVSLATESLEPGRVLALNSYFLDEPQQSFWVVTGQDLDDEAGAYREWHVSAPSTGKMYTVLDFYLYPPNEEISENWLSSDRLELVDGVTGEVLIENLWQAHENAVGEIAGRVSEEPPEPQEAQGAQGLSEGASVDGGG